MTSSRSYLLAAFLLGALLAAGYLLKVVLRIDLLPGFSLTDHAPVLHRLDDRPQPRPAVGELLRDDFEVDFVSARRWSVLWSPEPDSVTQNKVFDPTRNSRCLEVVQTVASPWGLPAYHYYAVESGDTFAFEIWSRFSGGEETRICVDTFDADLKSVDWNAASTVLATPDQWQRCELRFRVPEGVAYVRFRLEGRGIGRSWFDDASLHRIR